MLMHICTQSLTGHVDNLKQSGLIWTSSNQPMPGRLDRQRWSWLIQLIWNVYYVCGTLSYTSIMAVTVVELFTWVVVASAVSITGKYLGFFICMQYEIGPR